MKLSGARTNSNRWGIATRRLLLLNLALVSLGCSGTEPSSVDLGVLQVRVDHSSLPDSIAVDDTLIAYLGGRPDSGNCFSLSHADVARDSTRVTITMWANARLWVGDGPPPPCGLVGYQYEGLARFRSGWFRVIANQPDSTQWVDSVWVVQ